MKLFRRKLALMICPELAELPSATTVSKIRSRSPDFEARGRQLVALDRAYTARTGTLLCLGNAPSYSGSMHHWDSTPRLVRLRSIKAIIRMREGRQAGVHPLTSFMARNYFSSIWPTDLEWPADIPRPEAEEDAA